MKIQVLAFDKLHKVFMENGYSKREVQTAMKEKEQRVDEDEEEERRSIIDAEHSTIYKQIQQNCKETQISCGKQNYK